MHRLDERRYVCGVSWKVRTEYSFELTALENFGSLLLCSARIGIFFGLLTPYRSQHIGSGIQ
jgi:hypothetical protein